MEALRGFLRRLPLSFKMVGLTVLVGGAVGFATDRYVGRTVDDMFRTFLEDGLRRQSQEDRLRFDRYARGFHQVARLAVSRKKFLDYLDEVDWFARADGPIAEYRTLPPWFLYPSILRTLAAPRFTLLLDGDLVARELFHNCPHMPPAELLRPSPVLLEKSYGQTHIALVGNTPYMVAAEAVRGESDRDVVLLLASPIDDELLAAVQGQFSQHLLGLVSPDGETLLASNDETLLPSGARLLEIEKDYLVTGREYLDYGGAEIAVRVSSFVPRERIEAMRETFADSERKARMFTTAAYIASFTLVMLWITRRIRRLTRRVEDFSRHALGAGRGAPARGDRLHVLEDRFERLTHEVVESHRIIRQDTEEKAARQHEIDEQRKQLVLLESVTDDLGVGVMIGTQGAFRPANRLAEIMAQEVVGLESLVVEPGTTDIRTLSDANRRERVFRLSSPRLLSDEEVVLVHEITSEKRAEREKERLQKELVQAQRLESVGRLAGGVAHDFNNILTAIDGFAELTLMKMGKDDPLRRYLRIIVESAERAKDLVGQLLAFSRKQIVKPEPVNLNKVLESTRKMLGRLIGEDIEIVVEKGEGLWNVLADRTQIEQVILNLAVNSRDAMPSGGRFFLETRNVVVDRGTILREVPPGEYVRLTVNDTGSGIDPRDMEKIFEPFFTTKELGKGTGLGLSTVYGIVGQNGGHIFVESEMGIGTTFRIYLPRIEKDENGDGPEANREAPPRGDEIVLLAEDDPKVRQLVVSVLTELGYTVLEASDGDEASRLLRSHADRVDLLLTDVVMPKKGGAELAGEIAEEHPRVKILYMTGYAEDQVVQQEILKDGARLIMKPLTPSMLAAAVRKCLDKSPERA